MFKTSINWAEELPNLIQMDKDQMNMVSIANHYGVSRQRIKQVCMQYGVKRVAPETRRQVKRDAYNRKWGDLSQDLYDIKRAKFRGKKANAKRLGQTFTIEFSEIIFPDVCPILGIPIDYESEGISENSPSFDQIIAGKGYVSGNVCVMSWRANRIKNDGTAEEHRKIAEWLTKAEK